MRNQDPDKPMDGTELATQLAQFSSVEQLLNISDVLTTQKASSDAMTAAIQANAAMGTVGKMVIATGNDVQIPASGDASVGVSVGGTGGSGTLEIYDMQGQRVGSRDLGHIDGGKQMIDLGSAKDGLAPGHYTYKVNCVDSAQKSVAVTTYTIGRADGVQYTSDGPVITAGSLTIPFKNVVEVDATS
jgi:flagellar basal-body rod modification protein FlgD